jgi:hypothetical protein
MPIIADPPAAHAVEEYRKAHPEAFVWKPSPGPDKVEAVRVGNAMVNREVAAAVFREAGRSAVDEPRRGHAVGP